VIPSLFPRTLVLVLVPTGYQGQMNPVGKPASPVIILVLSFFPKTLLLLPSGYHTVLLQCPLPTPAGINLRGLFFSCSFSEGCSISTRRSSTGTGTCPLPTDVSPFILRVNVTRTVPAIIPAGYQRYCRLLLLQVYIKFG